MDSGSIDSSVNSMTTVVEARVRNACRLHKTRIRLETKLETVAFN